MTKYQKVFSYLLNSPVYPIAFWLGIGITWWTCAFIFGFFQIIMWSIVLTAILGIILRLQEHRWI